MDTVDGGSGDKGRVDGGSGVTKDVGSVVCIFGLLILCLGCGLCLIVLVELSKCNVGRARCIKDDNRSLGFAYILSSK
jgi:hypothetical protein